MLFKNIALSLLISLCMHNNLNGMLFNYDAGTTVAGTIEQRGRHLTLNGCYYAMQKVAIDTNKLDGNGLIEAPTIIIKTKNFDFSGTIRCHNKCIIYVEEAPCASFKKEGPGSFEIITGKDNKQLFLSSKESVTGNHFSLEPLKHSILEFPERHPIQTAVLATILAGVVAHKIVKMVR